MRHVEEGKAGGVLNHLLHEFLDKVIHINRCAKVVKGGRRFSFSALVVSGDQQGNVGVGYGKAKQVPEAIRKGTEQARKRMQPIPLNGDTIPHSVIGQADGGKVLLRPASQGTGVIAGGGVRAVLEAAGIKNILSKSLGSNNQLAIVKATMAGLNQLRTAAMINAIRKPNQIAKPKELIEPSSEQQDESGNPDDEPMSEEMPKGEPESNET